MKCHICLNENKMQYYFEKVKMHVKRPLDTSHFGMKFITISLRRENKCVNSCMIEHYLFRIKKMSNLTFSRSHKTEVFDSHLKENHFVL